MGIAGINAIAELAEPLEEEHGHTISPVSFITALPSGTSEPRKLLPGRHEYLKFAPLASFVVTL